MTPGMELVRLTDSIVWELRRFFTSGKRVRLTLVEEAGRFAEGHVTGVSPTGSTVTVAGKLIPAETILAVHRPVIMSEDTNWVTGRWHFDPYDDGSIAGQLRIPGLVA